MNALTDNVWFGAVSLALALLLGALLVLMPSAAVDVQKRLGVRSQASLLTRATNATTGLIDRHVVEGRRRAWERALDRAGIRRTVPEFVLLAITGAFAAFAAGFLLANVAVGFIFAVFVIAGAVVFVNLRSDKRKANFADQLDDILTLLASNLRAGHSLQQSLDALSAEIDEPAASEITRAVTQVRVGRDLGAAIADVAERMDSDDFGWVAQAIAIHRQVGGNLADVLDTVAETIRERGQVRRQVQALSAEGKLSAWVLIALPFFVIVALFFLNPGYLAVLTTTTLGYVMIAVACVLLVVGIFWMRATVKVEF